MDCGSWLSLLFAFFSVCAAIYSARMSQKQYLEYVRERKYNQAENIFIWKIGLTFEHDDIYVDYGVVNRSDYPIYNVCVECSDLIDIYERNEIGGEFDYKQIIKPRTDEKQIGEYGKVKICTRKKKVGFLCDVDIDLYFTDIKGIKWKTNSQGELREIKCDYMKMFKKIDLAYNLYRNDRGRYYDEDARR